MPNPTIDPLDASLRPEALWSEVATRTVAWAEQRGIALRDAIVLVPFAALLGPARRAFSARGGWMPRIESTQTLASLRAPAPLPRADQMTFDVAFDALTAAALLEPQAWARAWAQRDSHGYGVALRQIVELAHALARASAAVPPPMRDAWAAAARDELAPLAGPGATERMLARIALEWASAAPTAASDALFTLRPAAWVAVRAGGSQSLAESVLSASDVPCLIFDTDAGVGDALGSKVRSALCDGFEDEASRAAACVIEHLRSGAQPVALIAQDRLLIRRVRALLARSHVAIADETGWKLSTTRAAASVMALLRAARSNATTDDWLDWLKCGAADAALDALELELRRRQWASVRDVDPARLHDAAARVWIAAATRLQPLRGSRRQRLDQWLDALRSALDVAALEADAAGRQVIAALFGPARVCDLPLTLESFSDWADATLEAASFVEADADAEPSVVITPLVRAMLRSFAAVVFPGADDQRLGGAYAAQPLLGDATAVKLGLPGVDAQRAADRLAFDQLLRVPVVTLLRRRVDGDEPLAASPWAERLDLRRHGAGLGAFESPPEARRSRSIEPTPQARPEPAPGRVPTRMSMSAVEALRECPYRFFARVVLGLREIGELDDEPEKRDFGTWLHAVLHAFHERREHAPADAEVARLLAIGSAMRASLGLDAAAFLPFEATFERFATRYVEWQRARDARGLAWQAGELERSLQPPALAGVELHGRIDRVDSGADGRVQLLDYKTGSVDSLRERVREPLEDTQLALYALLTGDERLLASYVALDDNKGIKDVEHRDVTASAAQLLDGLAVDLQRMREGAPLPPLGEGAICDRCEARGLCRKDEWERA